MLTIIAAMTNNRCIGNGGQLPFSIASEMRHFTQTTTNHVVVMGRKTWDSLDQKPLKNRLNVVLSKSKMKSDGKFLHLSDPKQVFELSECGYKGAETYIIGGQSIYELFLMFADKIILSEVDIEVDGDAFFPTIPAGIFYLKSGVFFNNENEIPYTVKTYLRSRRNEFL